MARKTSNEALEKRIKEAFTHVAPNDPSSVLASCGQSSGKGQILMNNQKKHFTPLVRRMAGMAAALILMCGVAVGLYAYHSNVAVVSTVSLDVNPSVEITTNKNEKVLNVTALNADGEIIIGDMSLKGSDLDVAVNALIGSMVQNGYINEVSNSILLSVNGKNSEKSAALREKLVAGINEQLKTDAVEGAVLSQTIGKDKDVKALAKEHGISQGKAQLIRQITTQNTQYTFEELVKLSINELNLLSESGSTRLENVELEGVASDKKYVGTEAALATALAHAELAEADVTGVECELDFEHGQMVYEIEFDSNGYEYDYVINAESGEIIRQSKKLPHGGRPEGEDPNKPAEGKPEEAGCTDTHITAEEALAKALAHAGIAADATLSDSESKLGRKRGACVYEVEFELDGYEYEYLIDATTGEVVKYEKELAGENNRPENGCPDKPEMPEGEQHGKPEMPEGEQHGKPEMPEGEESARPERPEMPEGEESARPERPEMPEGEESGKPERPEMPEMPEGEETAQPARPERPEMPEGEESGKPERPEMPEGEESGKPERPEMPEGEESGKPERPEMPVGEESGKPERPEMPEGEESGKPERPEMPEGEESARPERPEMPEGEETAQPGRPERPEMPEGEMPTIPEEGTDVAPQEGNGDFGLQPMHR